ncbi:MAG: DUF4198 domain-containing protein [bacterium]|nr:DUF4198 domain-containing protein [bacterium]
MRRHPALICLFFVCVVEIVSIGCSNDLPSLGTVRGQVTLNGKPYPNAQVQFTPVEGRPSLGVSDGNGEYELVFIRTTKGAEIGKHKVSITTVVEAPEDPQPDGGRGVKEPIPPKYNSRTTLTAEVTSGVNEIDFPLETK